MARTDPLNATRYWRDRYLAGVNLLHADLHTQHFAPHRHDSLAVAVTDAGGSIIKCRNRVDDAHPATLLVFNPDEAHASKMGTSRQWGFRSLHLEKAATTDVVGALGTKSVPYLAETFVADADLIAGFRALHSALESGQDPLGHRQLMVMAFGTLFERYGDGAPLDRGPGDRRRLSTVVDVMHVRLESGLTLQELASAVGLTEFQVTSLVKRTTGLTPYAYFTQLRLERAQQLLRRGVPIVEAAVASGFYDQAALTKHFKNAYGVTPLQFARATRGSFSGGR